MRLQDLRRRLAYELRFPAGAACHRCGWADVRALVAGSMPLICYACRRERLGKLRTEGHHVGGRDNPYGRVAQIDANVHRILSDRWYDRPADLRAPLYPAADLRRLIDAEAQREEREERRRLGDDPAAAIAALAERYAAYPDRPELSDELARQVAGLRDLVARYPVAPPPEDTPAPPWPAAAEREADRLRILAGLDEADVRELVDGDLDGARELRRAALWTYRRWRLWRAWDAPEPGAA